MRVSVIVPVQRGLYYLRDCLTSLAEQNIPDMEVILACDHVTEFDVEEAAAAYRPSLSFTILYLNDGTGAAAARNMGLAAAKGDYIYFLDSDDYLYNDALARLVQAAEKSGAQVVYGIKKKTWYKRDIFVENLRKDEAQKNDQEAESEKEFVVLKESESGENLSVSLDDRGRSQARNVLFSDRKGINDVSVLNILVKRSLLEENDITFREEFRYYSDLSFVLEILEHAEQFEWDAEAVYVQRKHNDPVHFPSLSQEKSEERFEEYMNAYSCARELASADEDLAMRIDRKIVNYFCGYFVTRMRRSENPAWNTTRFDRMREIISGMPKAVFDELGGYKKRSIKALLKGDRKRVRLLVNLRLGSKKLKTFLSRPREIYKYLYRHYFTKLSLKENYVLCESFFGKSYSDSPKYIFEYISKNYPGRYKFIWVLNRRDSKIPYPHKRIRRFSLSYAYYLARCKYFVFNVRQPMWVQKRKGNIFLETWHGTPLKRLVFDQEEVTGASPLYKYQFYVQVQLWDYLIAANQFSSDTFRQCFCFEKKMLETGYPRNDILHSENRDELAAGLRKKLGIPADKKTILYAPTWRDDEYYDKGQYKFALKLDLHRLKEQLGDEYVLLLRTHYFIADALDVTGLEDFAFNLSKYEDISELYLISDLLVTDYSSVFFDYANLKRPILFYTYDLEKYRDDLRGFYIDIEQDVPGPLLFTQDELVHAIKNISEISLQYSEKYDIFYERFCSWEDGHAAERCAQEVFDLR
ncbi:bifunctional glycosyltransferase family 2 protein/CDP-glycerol:glycerophosphate glycerophosphotransferase [Anaerolentibacter hominis]|uniref:bifunctional glycosyltransferase/CDP-glycerol:glycerophosphate glycerophosphotransferase n=1 Tax=Anaerolentibacter hominis TaxID=3079009 RepID=UPI0031B80004